MNARLAGTEIDIFTVIMFFSRRRLFCQLSLHGQIYRGYYMPARGYEFYLRVVNSISHE